jgi:hypothetical protein
MRCCSRSHLRRGCCSTHCCSRRSCPALRRQCTFRQDNSRSQVASSR